MKEVKKEQNFGKESQLIDMLELEKIKAREVSHKLAKVQNANHQIQLQNLKNHVNYFDDYDDFLRGKKSKILIAKQELDEDRPLKYRQRKP